MTYDYKRYGTTTLYAALDMFGVSVIGRCVQRHRHQEFIRFLNAVEPGVPAGKVIPSRSLWAKLPLWFRPIAYSV